MIIPQLWCDMIDRDSRKIGSHCVVWGAWGCVACVQGVVTRMVLRVACHVVCCSVSLFRRILEAL